MIMAHATWGYALAMNNTYDYKLAQGTNPLYPRIIRHWPEE